MYIPKYFKVTNVDEIWDFVQKTLLEQSSQQKKRNQSQLICPLD